MATILPMSTDSSTVSIIYSWILVLVSLRLNCLRANLLFLNFVISFYADVSLKGEANRFEQCYYWLLVKTDECETIV